MCKRVLVTGVARGIGRAIAERFLQEGYMLIGTYYTSKEMAYELENQFGADRVHLFGPYDFTDLDEVRSLLVVLKSYKYDVIICNAGVFSENDDFNNFDLYEFNRTMNCNFYTPLLITTELRDNVNRNGSIVIMSSNDAYFGAFASMSYSISNSALLSLVKCLSINYGEKNVRVNSVAPGLIDTDMNTPEGMNLAPYFTPISRCGTPSDVASVVYFLASNEAGFVNGENITIDGGYRNVSVLLKSEADPAFSCILQRLVDDKYK